MENNKQHTLRLSEKQHEKLKAIAKKEKRSISAVIRNLIDDEAERTKPNK